MIDNFFWCFEILIMKFIVEKLFLTASINGKRNKKSSNLQQYKDGTLPFLLSFVGLISFLFLIFVIL